MSTSGASFPSPGGADPSFELNVGLVLERALRLGAADEQIHAWFTSHQLSDWGVTAQELVQRGQIADVLDELERMAEGVFS
ncbi:hypothetical protein [Novosphingobium sp. CCH12-A3]|uniref:hypothetical protein n=1 Tax=Novosphingobium sp. CCH12-A3 TaxID=1768752 RepID=UPI0007811255|nr:hypothetical protein [Novosphingobium sp. CCH12-A3]